MRVAGEEDVNAGHSPRVGHSAQVVAARGKLGDSLLVARCEGLEEGAGILGINEAVLDGLDVGRVQLAQD